MRRRARYLTWPLVLLSAVYAGGAAALAGPGDVTAVSAGAPSWRRITLDRTPSPTEMVAVRIAIAADSFHPGRHVIVDVPSGPAFVAQIMREAAAEPADGTLWFDAAIPFRAFNDTTPSLSLRFLLDEGCKPGEAVPTDRGPLLVTAVDARLAPLAP
ncbi:hypothetical protein [Niveispirillum fermenti]|uniref:hypothetical protein n=1 Tax=Niveispirillum fermenti TaxID=1233113 RepID=UPI003A85B5C8